MIEKWKHIRHGAAAVCLACVLLTGCTSSGERLEKEEAYRTIGINAMEKGDYAAAMEAFNNALEQAKGIGANEIDICFYKAAAQFSAGNLRDAVETYDLLLESDKKNSDAYFLRGCVWLKLNESDMAQEDFSKAVKYAENHEIYLMIYTSLSGEGLEEEGQEYLEEALKKKAGRKAENYTVKGRVYLQRQEYEDAVDMLLKAAEEGDTEAYLYLAQAYEASGDDKKAGESIDAYVEIYPESSVAYNQMGRKEMSAGNYEKAVSYFSKGLALEEVANEQELRSNLIAAYEFSGDFEKAGELMGEYVKDYPDDAAAARENMFLNKNKNEEKDKK